MNPAESVMTAIYFRYSFTEIGSYELSYVDKAQSGNALARVSLIGSVANTVIFFGASALRIIPLMNLAMLLAFALVVLGLISLRKPPRRLAAIGIAIGSTPLWLPIVIISMF